LLIDFNKKCLATTNWQPLGHKSCLRSHLDETNPLRLRAPRRASTAFDIANERMKIIASR
jgi:hypothetical protein